MAYKDIINNICSNIHTGLIDFDEPRSEASMPTQASSEFITNKQQGDWQRMFYLGQLMIILRISLLLGMVNLMTLLQEMKDLKNSSMTIKQNLMQLANVQTFCCTKKRILMNLLVMILV